MAVAEACPVQSVMHGYVETRLKNLAARGRLVYRRLSKATGVTGVVHYQVVGVDNHQEFLIAVGSVVRFADDLCRDEILVRFEDPDVFKVVAKHIRRLVDRKVCKTMGRYVWYLDRYGLEDYRADLDQSLRELGEARSSVAKYSGMTPRGAVDARHLTDRLAHAKARVQEAFGTATFLRAQIEAGTKLVKEYGKQWDFTGG